MTKSFKAKQRRKKRRQKANPHLHANPEMARAIREQGSSSAAGPHDGQSRSTRTRSAREKGAIRDASDV